MELGQRLKNMRVAAGFTQEDVAEKLGVSRQTVSNWENDKYYPDIGSIISLSNLYSVSLDVLLKEDKKMIEHLENSTNIVKSHGKLSKTVLIMSYIIVWTLLLLTFWVFAGVEQSMIQNIENVSSERIEMMGNIVIIMLTYCFTILPAVDLIVSIFIGSDESWGKFRWLMILFFGLTNLAAILATFMPYAVITLDAPFRLEYDDAVISVGAGMLGSALGMAVGILIKNAKSKKNAGLKTA